MKKEFLKAVFSCLGIWGIYGIFCWALYQLNKGDLECRRASEALDKARKEEKELKETAALFNVINKS